MKLLSFLKKGKNIRDANFFTTANVVVPVCMPRKVCLKLSRSGKCVVPIVKVGDKVRRGQKIAESINFNSVSVHASISGTVTDISVQNFADSIEEAIIITASDEDHDQDEANRAIIPEAHDWHSMSSEKILVKIADAGVRFFDEKSIPIAKKMPFPKYGNILIIDAIENNEYLTCNDALLCHHAFAIIEGIKIMMAATMMNKAVVFIGKNIREAYTSLREIIAFDSDIKIKRISTRHFNEYKDHLIKTMESKEDNEEAPIVMDVASVFAVYRAVAFDMPLIDRMITIAGKGNFQVPIGMYISELLTYAPERQGETDIVICGEEMKSISTTSLDIPVDKSISGLLIRTPANVDSTYNYKIKQ